MYCLYSYVQRTYGTCKYEYVVLLTADLPDASRVKVRGSVQRSATITRKTQNLPQEEERLVFLFYNIMTQKKSYEQVSPIEDGNVLNSPNSEDDDQSIQISKQHALQTQLHKEHAAKAPGGETITVDDAIGGYTPFYILCIILIRCSNFFYPHIF